jgi:hypothetical protein
MHQAFFTITVFGAWDSFIAQAPHISALLVSTFIIDDQSHVNTLPEDM